MDPLPIDGSWGLPPAGLPYHVLRHLNDARDQAGVSPLVLHSALMGAAQAHAADMARHRVVSTTSLDGNTLAHRARMAGYLGDVACWALRSTSAAQALRGLLDEPAVQAVLLHPLCAHAGLGLREGHFALLLSAPFILDEEAARTRVRQLVAHARLLRDLPPVVPSTSLDALARHHLAAPADPLPGYLGRAVFQVLDATPSRLKSALFDAFADPAFGAALHDPAFHELGLFLQAGGTHLCLALGAPRPPSSIPA
jgi:hypothetical protein